jgi:hypothetical protein
MKHTRTILPFACDSTPEGEVPVPARAGKGVHK